MKKEVTVSANGLTIVHKGSKGKAISTIPDICCIPGPNGKIPIPFTCKAESKDLEAGTLTVQIHGQNVAVMGSYLSKCKGDKAGKLGGIISGSTEGKCHFFSFSSDVRFEMRPVVRKTDRVFMNDFNTVCMGGVDQKNLKQSEPIKEDSYIEIELVDEDGNGISNEPYEILTPDRKVIKGQLDANGYAKIEGVRKGRCKVRYPKIDHRYKSTSN